MLASMLLIASLVACNEEKDEEMEQETAEPEVETEQDHGDDEKDVSDSGDEKAIDEKPVDEELEEDQSIEQEQKQMALDMLHELVKDAEEGRVYRLSEGIFIGETTREEVYDLIGEPEEKDEFEHYHGSMGYASYDLAYDEDGILKEARYFGTNVERQTNLGGITEKDLKEQIGEPAETRVIESTDETNDLYRVGAFEIQFILGEDGTVDHVNLLKA